MMKNSTSVATCDVCGILDVFFCAEKRSPGKKSLEKRSLKFWGPGKKVPTDFHKMEKGAYFLFLGNFKELTQSLYFKIQSISQILSIYMSYTVE